MSSMWQVAAATGEREKQLAYIPTERVEEKERAGVASLRMGSDVLAKRARLAILTRAQ